MQIQDCSWEIENIGKRTVQLNYSLHDKFDIEKVVAAIEGYQYIVAKVACGNTDVLLGLQDDGFKMIETQIKLSKDFLSFEDEIKPFEGILKDVSFREVSSISDFENMTNSIDEKMFSTDRITLDTNFGPAIGRKRYVGWMKNEYKARTSSFWWINIVKQSIGFMMLRFSDKRIDCLLNGLFTPFHKKGLGIITPASALLMAKKNNIKINNEHTCISSNNAPVVHLYNKLNFKIEGMDYVLIKHVANLGL